MSFGFDRSADGTKGESDLYLDDADERYVVFKTIDSFYQYARHTHHNTTHIQRQNFYAMSREHQDLMKKPPYSMLHRFDQIDEAIDKNAQIAKAIMKVAIACNGFDHEPGNEPWYGTADPITINKAATTIKQFYRDWSSEGARERSFHISPILQDIQRIFGKLDDHGKSQTKILVPGAGLGRLVCELVHAGYNVEGNEFSYHMLYASMWILNVLQPGEKFELYPWVTENKDQVGFAQQIQKVTIPDLHPGTSIQNTGRHGEMSMTATDFITHYEKVQMKAAFDAVATLFFIDTAPNVLRYIETIRNTLKPGGYWINLGPLHWHFDGMGPGEETHKKDSANGEDSGGVCEPGRIVLNQEDLVSLITAGGLEILQSEVLTDNGYIQQESSLSQRLYRPWHFVARRSREP